MEKNKDNYTFLEMLLALREHYQNMQLDLDLMKENTFIDAKVPVNTNLWLWTLHENMDPNTYPARVQLNVEKKVWHPKWYEARRVHGGVSDMKEHAYFVVETVDGYPQYRQAENNPYFQPTVMIPNYDNEEFTRYYEDLQKSFFWGSTAFTRNLNPFQHLDVSSVGLSLDNYGGGRLLVFFDPKDGYLHFYGGRDFYANYYPDRIREILKTKIPKNEVREEYHPIIDAFESPVERINLLNGINRNDVMSLDVDDNILVLRRVEK